MEAQGKARSVLPNSEKANAHTFLDDISLFESSDDEVIQNAKSETTLPEMSLATPLPTSSDSCSEKIDKTKSEESENSSQDVEEGEDQDDEDDEEDAPWEEEVEADITVDVSVLVSDSEEPENQTLALEEEALDLLNDLSATEKSLPALTLIQGEIEQIKKKNAENLKKSSLTSSFIPALFSRKRKRSDDDEDEEADREKELEEAVKEDTETLDSKPADATDAADTTDDIETPVEPVQDDARPTKRIRKAIGRFSTFAIGAAAGSMMTIAALLASAPPQQ